MENTKRTDRAMVINYGKDEARMLRVVASLLDTTPKELLYHSTMAYLVTLAHDSDDAILTAILQGKMAPTSGLPVCAGATAPEEAKAIL